MVKFTAIIQKFDKQGEKTGWTYIDIPPAAAEELYPNQKKSYRVKGKLDTFPVKQLALTPMGGGHFILVLNAAIRKGIAKRKGSTVDVQLSVDKEVYQLNSELMECLADEPEALKFFTSKPLSHQHYYSKWIEAGKTAATRARRIAMSVSSLAKKMDFGEMLRSQRDLKEHG